MSKKLVLVTGALAGIGRATASAFARHGASVVVCGRRDEKDAWRPGSGSRAARTSHRADVTIEDDVESLVHGTSTRSESRRSGQQRRLDRRLRPADHPDREVPTRRRPQRPRLSPFYNLEGLNCVS